MAEHSSEVSLCGPSTGEQLKSERAMPTPAAPVCICGHDMGAHWLYGDRSCRHKGCGCTVLARSERADAVSEYAHALHGLSVCTPSQADKAMSRARECHDRLHAADRAEAERLGTGHA